MLFWTLIIFKLCLRLFVKSDKKKDIRQFMKEKAFLIAEV